MANYRFITAAIDRRDAQIARDAEETLIDGGTNVLLTRIPRVQAQTAPRRFYADFSRSTINL